MRIRQLSSTRVIQFACAIALTVTLCSLFDLHRVTVHQHNHIYKQEVRQHGEWRRIADLALEHIEHLPYTQHHVARGTSSGSTSVFAGRDVLIRLQVILLTIIRCMRSCVHLVLQT
jgi:hypothetical protein